MGKDDDVVTNSKQLFDIVLVVELQEETTSANQSGPISPFISYRFPKLWEKDPFSASVTQFCFPDCGAFPTEKMEKEFFTFVLTEADGDRRFGYCLRKLTPGQGPRFPVAFSIMTFFPCYTLYTKILECVAYHYENSSGADLSSFLQSVLENQFPKPGDSFGVTAKMNGKIESWRFQRPNEDRSQLEYVNTEPLLSLMDEQNILTIFISLLIERRIIFCSSKLSTLSSVVQAVVALIYPFTWQHIFIPVLPKSLLLFCCAPMPFVVGILYSSLQEVLQQPMEEVLIVDIDNNEFLMTPSNDIELLPPHIRAPLVKTLRHTSKIIKKARRKRKKCIDQNLEKEMAMYDQKQQSKFIAELFLNFFIYLIRDYRAYLKGEDFDKEGFVNGRNEELKEFAQLLVGAQLFERFVQERIHNLSDSGFDKRIEEANASLNDAFIVALRENLGLAEEQTVESLEDIFGKHNVTSRQKTAGSRVFNTFRKGVLGKSKDEEIYDISGPVILNTEVVESSIEQPTGPPPTPPPKPDYPPRKIRVPKRPMPVPQKKLMVPARPGKSERRSLPPTAFKQKEKSKNRFSIMPNSNSPSNRRVTNTVQNDVTISRANTAPSGAKPPLVKPNGASDSKPPLPIRRAASQQNTSSTSGATGRKLPTPTLKPPVKPIRKPARPERSSSSRGTGVPVPGNGTQTRGRALPTVRGRGGGGVRGGAGSGVRGGAVRGARGGNGSGIRGTPPRPGLANASRGRGSFAKPPNGVGNSPPVRPPPRAVPRTPTT